MLYGPFFPIDKRTISAILLSMRFRSYFSLLILAAALSGCAGGRPPVDFSSLSDGTGPAPTPIEARVIKIARSLIGVPYRFGGETPKGFDCSGFVGYVFRKAAGVDLPRVSHDQARSGKAVSVDDLRPGDLIYFKIEHQKPLHVGIYLGRGKFIHAPSSRGRVNIQSLSVDYWRKRYRGARRVI
jgi:cell wall-associated NlpC family hydrolase